MYNVNSIRFMFHSRSQTRLQRLSNPAWWQLGFVLK
jgi:hypothetical protein